MAGQLIDNIRKKLQTYGKTYIALNVIEKWVSAKYSYDEFADAIAILQSENILIPTKTTNTNGKKKPLPLKFRLNAQSLFTEYYQLLHQKQHYFHPMIRLDQYFKLDVSIFMCDLPWIEAIDQYLKVSALPQELMYIPQLSLKLVNNEKWMDDLGGIALLKRINLWDKLPLIDRIDPIAFTINPNRIHANTQYHLIVENKTPYRQCTDFIGASIFSTIIYGKGKQICSGIRLFLEQYPVHADHHFIYFGDLDWEGLGIYKTLSKYVELTPARSFYKAMLKQTWIPGKSNQKENKAALEFFAQEFGGAEAESIKEHLVRELKNKHYLPQEVIDYDIIGEIMKQSRSDYESI